MHKLKRLIHFYLVIGILMINTSCANSNNNPITTDNAKITAIVNNKQSMTTALKKLNNNFTVNLLYSGVESNNYKRIVDLKLSNTTVLVAVSSTKISNPTFMDILSNAQSSSIGLKLFAPNSHIKRDPNMNIQHIKVSQISSDILINHLVKLNYNLGQTIIQRTSVFYYKNESMTLFEYVLPSLNQFM